MLAVDYLDRPPETWYSVRLHQHALGSPGRLALDMSALEETGKLNGLYSGLHVRIEGKQQPGGGVKASHIEVLPNEQLQGQP